MTAHRRNPAAGVAVGVALAALCATPALARSPHAARTIAKGESIVIDGRTFSITPGTSKGDRAPSTEQLRGRPLGAGVIIFRREDGLYMVDRAPPPAATTADAPTVGRSRADGLRNSSVECGRSSALRDQGIQAPNEACERTSALRDMERPRPFAPRDDVAVDRQRPHGLRDAAITLDDIEHMDANPRIHIEYQLPKDPAQKPAYDIVRQRRMLEMVSKVFSPWNLGDVDLNIRTMTCGASNAWYQRIDKVPTVSICYEYLVEIWQSMPEETKAVQGDTMKDVICGQLFFAVAHELGHAMFDIFDVPVFGRQEDAADQFATYNILQFGGDQALQLINGAAFAYHLYVKDLAAKPQVTLPLVAFSSDHGAPEERYFNLICIAYGYDQRLFSLVMDKLPSSRAKNCKYEYQDLKFAMRTVFWPHIDQEKATRVLAMKWFVDPNATASASKTKAN